MTHKIVTDMPVVKAIPVTQARAHLGELLKRVRINREAYILEKDGIPMAGLIDIDDMEDYLEIHDPKVREHIRKSYQEYLDGKSRPLKEFIAELEGKKRAKPKRRG